MCARARVCCLSLGDALWMVEFYAPWCSHCMKNVPLYKRAAVLLDGEVEFGAVNCKKAR